MSQLRTSSELISAARLAGVAGVVSVRGEVGIARRTELRTELIDRVARHAPQRLVLNLSQVPYMDSSAIAVLVELLKKVRLTDGKVYLTSLQPRVKGLVEIARLGSIFGIVADEAEALK